MACLSCPCFLDSKRTWSFNKPQSPESLLSVTMVRRILEVVARSEACRIVSHCSTVYTSSQRAYLSCLLLQHQELVDGCLHVRLPIKAGQYGDDFEAEEAFHTFASASASGMSLSASLEKSFSGLKRGPSDMVTRVDTSPIQSRSLAAWGDRGI